jgi:DNA-directed RNA polymerase III subunit RPC6
LCQENEGGVTNRVLDQVFTGVRPEMRALVINKLLSNNKIEILTKGDQLLYRVGQSDKGKNDEERVVYSIIENAGNKGIWTKDIRFKCNISMLALNKVLKQMESKKLIKSVKSVTASKKKLYMLFELEPDVSVTGGTWYSNQDFEAEFVDVLNQQCLRFLQEKVSTSSLLFPLQLLTNASFVLLQTSKESQSLGNVAERRLECSSLVVR